MADVIDIAGKQILLFGFSLALLRALQDSLPARSVLVVEEPDIIRNRGVHALTAETPMVSRVIEAEYQSPAGLAELLERETFVGVAAVVPGLEYAVVAAAHAADRLGLPGAGTLAGAVFRDKYELRELASGARVSNPEYALVADPAEAVAFFAAAGRPCVLKPTCRQASLGVQIITERAQIADGWALSSAPDEGYRIPSRGMPTRLLMEHALSGPEYSVETLVSEGEVLFENVTAKRVLPGRFPVEMGHVVPGIVPAALATAMSEANKRIIAAADFGTGILHSEWIAVDGVPVLVECAARMPGDEIGTLISTAYDFPLAEAYVRLLLGERPELPAGPMRGAAIVFLHADAGNVLTVDGIANAKRMPGVRSVRMGVGAGDRVRPITSSWDRTGYVLAEGADAAEAQRRADEAAGKISVTVRLAELDRI